MVSVEDSSAAANQRYPIADAVKAEALESYEPAGETKANQLRLSAGDVVWVLEQHDSGWWGGHKEGDDMMGWFPADMVSVIGTAREEGFGEETPHSRLRCSPTASVPADALRTLDLRAVASPQACGGGRRRLTIQEQKEKEQEFASELLEASRRWEAELAAERRRSAEAVEALEAKFAQLKREHAVLAQELEMEKQGHRLERQHALETDQRAKDTETEARRLAEALLRREAELTQTKGLVRALEEANAGLREERLLAGRPVPADVSRRLFAQGLMPEGSRTPPPPPSSVSMATAPAVCTAPVLPSMLPAMGAMHPISSRHAAASMPRPGPSPRTAAAASAPGLQWLATGTAAPATGPAPSPHLPLHRGPFPPSGREPLDTAPGPGHEAEAAQVRTLVSEFERRSNSQGAPPRTDPSPNRQFVYAAASVRLRPTGSSCSRAGSREIPIARIASGRTHAEQQHAEQENSLGISACGEEHPSAVFNFGMSPMPRQVHQALPARAAGVASPSPTTKAPQVSVQDRIRQFNPPPASRYGR